jgi:hypothetical protein
VKAKTWYTIGWLVWFAAFAALEGPALFNHLAGDTLSEHVWSWFRVFDPHPGVLFGTLRVLLGLGLTWLALHLTFGWNPGRPIPGIGAFMTPLTPTQTRHPWRATLRTVVAAGVGLATLAPTIAIAAHVDTVPAVVQVLGVTGAITRVLAAPGVDRWVRRYLPWLAASPSQPY